MVDCLRESGVIITTAVDHAMAEVPRHLFLPQVDVRVAYLDRAVFVKHDRNGSPISSASQPRIVAKMLEQLQVSSGHHVLEIGTGTGYNAALLGVLTRSGGLVATVELEPDLAERAAQVLAHLGYGNVEVIVGNGREGYSQRAPYDRVIVTTGANEVAIPWSSQLRDGGRMVVPIVDRNGVGSIVTFEKEGGRLRPCYESPCGFLPIRDTVA
jgi:protein-L-isoaspartate(D-aspartate) O-methyltransferase